MDIKLSINSHRLSLLAALRLYKNGTSSKAFHSATNTSENSSKLPKPSTHILRYHGKTSLFL